MTGNGNPVAILWAAAAAALVLLGFSPAPSTSGRPCSGQNDADAPSGVQDRAMLCLDDDVGIGLQVGELEGSAAAHVWTQQFGSRC